MFIDEFFYPPEVYEYMFGEFTLNEIEELDRYIADLFDTRFPEYYEDDDGIELDGNRDQDCCFSDGITQSWENFKVVSINIS